MARAAEGRREPNDLDAAAYVRKTVTAAATLALAAAGAGAAMGASAYWNKFSSDLPWLLRDPSEPSFPFVIAGAVMAFLVWGTPPLLERVSKDPEYPPASRRLVEDLVRSRFLFAFVVGGLTLGSGIPVTQGPHPSYSGFYALAGQVVAGLLIALVLEARKKPEPERQVSLVQLFGVFVILLGALAAAVGSLPHTSPYVDAACIPVVCAGLVGGLGAMAVEAVDFARRLGPSPTVAPSVADRRASEGADGT